MCFDCGMSGPNKQTSEDAVSAWDALPRRDEVAPFTSSVCFLDETEYHVMIVHDGPTTLCAISWRYKGRRYGFQGMSVCNPGDTYDQAIGDKLAIKRACGVEGRCLYDLRAVYNAWRKSLWENTSEGAAFQMTKQMLEVQS
jgi:hypothetical protein